ncbi:MAG: hypothetical protein AAGD38_16040 [Acidobacteriota bacterium]
MFTLRLAIRVFVLAILTSITAHATVSTCDVLLPDDSVRVASTGVDHHCHQLDLAASGLLHLSLHGATARVVIDDARVVVLDRRADERLVWIEAGTYIVEIVAEDPLHPLDAYRLETRFEELTRSETDGELELEPELDAPLRGDDVAIQVRGEEDGELELEPELDNGDSQGLRVRLDALCRHANDDHADTLACASQIDHRIVGALDNGWGDDVDVFRLELDGWQAVEITIGGAITPRITLLDPVGQRLDVDSDGRLVRTLSPGTYYLRVDSEHEVGAYDLLVNPLGR